MSPRILNKIIISYSAIALIVISSIKWKTGTDWPSYFYTYVNIPDYKVLGGHFEPLYILLAKALYAINPHFTFYQIIFSVLVIGTKFYAITQLRFPITATILYAVNFQFDIYFVRYDLALSIILLLLVSAPHNKLVSPVLYIIPVGFHKVALLSLIFTTAITRPKSPSTRVIYILLIFILAIILIYFMSQPVFLYKISNGVYNFSYKGEINIKFIHRIWYLVLILSLFKLSNPTDSERSILKLLLVGAIFYILLPVFEFGSLERIFGVFLIYEMYYLSTINISSRKIYLTLYFTTIGSVRIIQFLNSEYTDLFFPYETILETRFKNVY